MEVLNCHSSDQMLDGIVLAVQTLNLHCFKSEILFGKLHEWNYGITVENGNDRHIHTENNCTGTCVPCVRWHWHWQRAFNLIVVLSGHTRSHWIFFLCFVFGTVVEHFVKITISWNCYSNFANASFAFAIVFELFHWIPLYLQIEWTYAIIFIKNFWHFPNEKWTK